ncbi:MAG: PQQ-binding-like beta-propeller repeat protein, partial [Acidobacteriota bacterium]
MKKILFALLACALLANAQNKNFRFAWLTDTHVGSETGAEDLRRSVRDINRMKDIAFVIHSGDVTEMGSTSELILAKSILDSLRVPYYIVPGNHDVKWSESGCSTFPRLWKDDKFTFEYAGVRFIGCASGPNMRQGDGHVPEEDVRWFDRLVTRLKTKPTPVIFINHYPLDEGLDNWYEITDRLRHVRTIAALCGHGHANRALEFEGLPGVMGRSNLRAKNAVGGYTIVSVRKDSLTFSERTPDVEHAAPGAGASEAVPNAMKEWHAIANDPARALSTLSRTYKRPDYSVNTVYKNVREVWKVSTGFTIGSSPAVAAQTVIVGNNKGAIEGYMLSSGKKKWSIQTKGSVYSTAAVAEGAGQEAANTARIVVGSSEGALYCIDPGRGRILWKHEARGPIVASPAISGDTVFCGASDGTFRALSLRSGRTFWEYPDVSGFVESTPLIYQNRVIFGAWDSYL